MCALAKGTVAAVLLLVLAIGTAPVQGAGGRDYYVAMNGDDASPGTLAQPWRTIARANQELQAGDSVYIRGGRYDEYIDPERSGTPGNKITYARYRDEEVLLQGEPGTAKLVALHTNSYVVIDGLTLSFGHPPPGGSQRWPWLVMASTAHHNEIRNLTLIREGDPLDLVQAGYEEWGMMLGASKHNTIENNYIRGLNQGIHIRRAAQYNLIQNNTITDTGQSSIVVSSSRGVIQGNLIQNNLLERSAVEDGIQFLENSDLPQGDERAADISNFGTIVRNNVIRYHNENAIDLKGAAHVVIEGNTIYGCVGSSNGPRYGWNRDAHGTITRGKDKSTRDVIIRHNVIYDSAPGIRAHQGYKIYNNTLVGNNRDYTGPNSSWTSTGHPAFSGIRQKDVGDGRITIQNNIIVGHNVVEAGLILTRSQSRTNHMDHNLYFDSRGVFFAHAGPAVDWQKLTLSMWQRRLGGYGTVTGNERSSFVADPLFVNAPEQPVGEHGQFDFRLRDGSPAIEAGGPLTRTEGVGSGDQVTVTDAGFFFDGYGVTEGDLVQIGSKMPARITSIDYGRNIITVDRSVSWNNGDWVSLPYAGAAPDIGARTCAGGCTPPPRPPIPDERVAKGLQVLYTFEDGGGTIVRDVSEVSAALDLRIENPSATTWSHNTLSIHAPTVIASSRAATKITMACQSANEITAEAWVEPYDAAHRGLARIVTLAADETSQNMILGQEFDQDWQSGAYGVQMRSTEQSGAEEPSPLSLPGSALPKPTHIVYTRDASGMAKMYVNNELHETEKAAGSLSNWDDSFPLALGNEPMGRRPWLGELYLVAIYCRALDSSEIWQNYQVGLDSIYEPQCYLPLVSR